jgi:hypothetical protein
LKEPYLLTLIICSGHCKACFLVFTWNSWLTD